MNNNISAFCTCTDYTCPLHPSNHNKGCSPCVAKNLKNGEIPSCFFKKINKDKRPENYSAEAFAKFVSENQKSK